jgi:hypothetical protein
VLNKNRASICGSLTGICLLVERRISTRSAHSRALKECGHQIPTSLEDPFIGVAKSLEQFQQA